jgi:hypothetical protein
MLDPFPGGTPCDDGLSADGGFDGSSKLIGEDSSANRFSILSPAGDGKKPKR